MKYISKSIIGIGALGGSGTRAVAEVFLQLGIFMGDDLNKPNDNLLFTRLFKNPKWYINSSLDEKEMRLRIFQKCMEGEKLNLNELKELYKAAYTNPTYKTKMFYFLKKLKYLSGTSKKNDIWGWKEPNTQIFVTDILNFFFQLKYIHVVRHGLDMAFSKNIQQLNNWGWKYNIKVFGNENENELAIKQLNYWIESNKDVIEKSKNYNDRILFINHSNFCQNPTIEIDRMLEYCDIKVSDIKRNKLYGIPKNTGSNNRYKDKDLSIFSLEQLQFVEKMGFEI